MPSPGATQLNFFGPPPPRRRVTPTARAPIHAVFLAILPPPPLAAAMADFAAATAAQNQGHDPRPADRIHLSLISVHKSAAMPPPGHLDRVQRLVSHVRHQRFQLSLDCMMRFAGDAVVLYCGDGAQDVLALQASITAAISGDSVKPKPSGKVPHITLYYGGAALPPRVLPSPFTWTVDQIHLIHSIQGQSIHKPLAQWSLGDATVSVPPRQSSLPF